MTMLRQFFFGNSDTKKNEPETPEIEDDQPRNKFNEIQILCGHTDLVDSLINITSSRVLSIGQDQRGILWDCQTGEILYELVGHTRVINSAFYLENYYEDDSNILDVIVTASSDETIRIWDLADGQCRKIVKEHGSDVKCFCKIACEPPMILSGGQDLCLWNLSFQLLSKLQRNSLDYVNTVISIKPNRFVVATDQSHLTVYNILHETSFPTFDVSHEVNESYEIKEYKKLPQHRESITFVLLISDGIFASASMDGTIIVWTTHRLEIIRQFNNYENFMNLADHTYPYKVNYMMVVDQKYIIAAIGTGFAIYDAPSDKCVCRVKQGHHSSLTCVALLSNGLYLATSSLDGTIRLWAAPLSLNYEDLSNVEEVSCVSRLFGRRFLETKSYPLKLELVGMCCGHSNSVKSIVECGMEGFISCGNDGLVILWKDSEVLQKIEDEQLRQVLANIGWMNH